MAIPLDIHKLLDHVTVDSRRILQTKFVGLYLHGSLAMDCFNPHVSDVDFLLVVDEELTDEEARTFLDTLVGLNEEAPPKGIEMSIVKRSVLKPFVYPTPHELHFSPDHLAHYREDAGHYIEHRCSSDPDLAAHITILRTYGIAWEGPPIEDVFGDVPHEAYLDSLLLDQADPVQEITRAPIYVTLNLCRMLAYVREGLVLSKAAAAQHALRELPKSFAPVISSALDRYLGNMPSETVSGDSLVAFAMQMHSWIQEALKKNSHEIALEICDELPNKEAFEHFLYLAIYVPEGEEPPGRDILDLPEMRIYVDAFGHREGDYAVGARIGRKRIGLAWVRKMKDYGYLDDESPSLAISVDPTWRSQGVGRRLMQALFERLREQGVPGVSLSVQKTSRAVEFYRSLGFTCVQERAEDYLLYRAL